MTAEPRTGVESVAGVDVTHRVEVVGDVRLHWVEAGPAGGPLVVLVHGFPESWRTWRHQIRGLAAAGHRVVALDVRGYGRSSRPAQVAAYGMLALVGDLVGLVGRLGGGPVTVVGHDWGAAIAWHAALLRPDVVTRVAALSVPYTPRSSTRPSVAFRRAAGPDREMYLEVFAEPGRAEAEIEPDVAGWLRGVYAAAFGPANDAVQRFAFVARGGRMRDGFPVDPPLPTWLEPEQMDHLVGEFERTGLTGALNRYRNFDRDWVDLAAWHMAPVVVPALFIGGSHDPTTAMTSRAIDRMSVTVPRLWRADVLDGCGHWIGEERPDDVNRRLVEFLDAVEP